MNSIPSRSTAPVRSSGSAAATAVSHAAGQLLLTLRLRAGRRRRPRGARGPGRRRPARPGRDGRRARSRAPAARRRPRRGPPGAGLDDAGARRSPRRPGSSASASATRRSATSGAAQGPLAVGEDGAVALVAAHPPVGPDLAGGLGEVTGVVRGDADGLADGGDPGRPVAGGAGVRQRGLGVLVDEGAGGHEVGRPPLGVARVEAAQGAAHRRVEVAGVDPLGDLRARRQRRTTVLAVGAADGRPAGPAGRRTADGPASSAAGRRAAADGHPADGGPATAAGRPCGRSPCGRRSPPLRTVAAAGGHPADGRPGDDGPATADGRRCGPVALRTAVLPLRAVARCGRSPCGRRSCHCGRSPRAAGHPADGGPATRRAARPTAADGRPADGRRCGGRHCGRSPCGTAVLPLRTVALRAVALRTAVLPLRTVAAAAVALRHGRLRTVTLRTAVLPLPRGDPTAADGRPADDGPATARRAPRPLRAVTLRTAVLPLRTVAGGPVARGAPDRCGRSPCGRRSCHCDAHAEPPTAAVAAGRRLRTTVLPAGPVVTGRTAAAGRRATAGTVALRARRRPRAAGRCRPCAGTAPRRTGTPPPAAARRSHHAGRRTCPVPPELRPAPEPRPSRGPSEPRRGAVMTSGTSSIDTAAHDDEVADGWNPDMKTRTGVRARSSDPRSVMVVRRRPTLPPRLQGSTIGAERLSFRVRNDDRAFPSRHGRRNSVNMSNQDMAGSCVQNRTVDAKHSC